MFCAVFCMVGGEWKWGTTPPISGKSSYLDLPTFLRKELALNARGYLTFYVLDT